MARTETSRCRAHGNSGSHTGWVRVRHLLVLPIALILALAACSDSGPESAAPTSAAVTAARTDVDCADPTTLPWPSEWSQDHTVVHGVHDLDGDGVLEIMTRPYGNTTQILVTSTVDDCALRPIEVVSADNSTGLIIYGYTGDAALGFWGDIVCVPTEAGVDVVQVTTEAQFERRDNPLESLREWGDGAQEVIVTVQRWTFDGERLHPIGEPLVEHHSYLDSPWPTTNEVWCGPDLDETLLPADYLEG